MPRPSNTAVVPPTSIAGISLGMPEAKAKTAWGAGRGRCASSETSGVIRCEYGSGKGASGRAYFEAFEGKVSTVGVYGGKNEYLASAAGALTKIKTASGIRIRSPYSKFKSASPKGEVLGKRANWCLPTRFRRKSGRCSTTASQAARCTRSSCPTRVRAVVLS